MTIFLYKKTHLVTGLNYLGKTISKDPHKYRGSGKYWLNHIKKHGYLVNTEILKECQTSEELINRYQVHKGNLSSVISGKLKYKSVSGWSITPYNKK